MAKNRKDLIARPSAFDYSPLEGAVAQRVRSAAERIRHKVKRTVQDIIDVGKSLIAVKEALPHGRFSAWLLAEFGWTERTARNFMAVADQFGSKTEMISDLRISPTAAYLLAAPSAPEEARRSAIDRAEAGEQITPTVAKEILSSARKKGRNEPKYAIDDDLAFSLVKVLERYRDRWNPKELRDMAQRLRDFADALEKNRR